MTDPRWLNETELRAWRGLRYLLKEFPRLENLFRDNDTSLIKYRILGALSEAPEAEVSLSELADRSHCSQSRLTQRMQSLIDCGHIATRESPEDRRVTLAALTPSGQQVVQTLAPQHVDNVRQLIFDHLTAEQTTALADILETVENGLRAASGGAESVRPPPKRRP